MKGWGIRARVLFLALAPSVMILLALVVYFTYERISEVDASLAQRGILVARQLAPGTEFALFAGDRAALQRLADAAVHEADVESVAITDAGGRELAHSGPVAPAAAGESLRFTQPVIQTRIAAADFPEQMQAGTAPAKIGEITVAMSRAGARDRQHRLVLIGLALGVAGLVLAIGLALVIGNSVIAPTRRLARAMVDLGQGRAVVPLPTTGGGEFRTLNEGFNRMAERLQAGTRELEARIAEATRALTAQKDRAEQATRAKSRFIAVASHDLRQPLHAIGLFAATLQRRAPGTALEDVVDDLAKAVSIMDRQFDALLDISRLDAGSVRADPRPFPLERLFDQLAAEYADTALQKGLRLHVKPTTAVVMTDELLLHRILSNLVANAIRYTDAGTVLVCCRPRGRDVQIEVRDSGIGISKDRQSDIFQEFVQIDDGAQDRGSGLGLGLAIVARLARLLATYVTVRSAPGRGSVFSLTVERGVQRTHAEPAASIAPTVWPDGLPLPVLVVDDDPLVLAGNRALLAELGCAVTTAHDERSAEAAFATLTGGAALVLCDFWLSGERTGIDLLRHLAALTTNPFSGILISGDTRPETINAAAAAGYPLLRKPVAPARLRAVVMQFAWKVRKNAGPELRDEDTAG